MLSVGRIEELAVLSTEGVTEEARDAIRGTDLGKGTVLDELKKVPPAEQMDHVLIAPPQPTGIGCKAGQSRPPHEPVECLLWQNRITNPIESLT